MLVDSFGREINYLRLAVTDRCNIRCQYCMPEKMSFLPRHDLLTYEELHRIVRLLVAQGITKVRLTGGEPFVRKDLISFIKALSKLKGLQNLNITSNGSLIEPYIRDLEDCGIDSINISLDTLNEQRYREITRRDKFDVVSSAIQKILTTDIRLKINMVVMRGINEEDIVPMAMLSKQNNVEVRYIEEMPFNGINEVKKPIDHIEILNTLNNHFGGLTKLAFKKTDTAQRYKIPKSRGSLGIIAAYTRNFCGSCNRIRITPQGELINCLYDQSGLDMRSLIRGGISDHELINEIQDHILKKHKDGHIAESSRESTDFQSMSLIGG